MVTNTQKDFAVQMKLRSGQLDFHRSSKKQKYAGCSAGAEGLLWAVVLSLLFGIAIVSHAQDQSGFINIDCGLAEASDYKDGETGINYSTDASFVDTGKSFSIPKEQAEVSPERPLWTVRGFPDGHRNCYSLSAAEGKGKKYLLRATFMYGNYDGKNQAPTFDLYLGAELWTTINLHNSTTILRKEIIYVPSSNYLYVCLVDTGNGTPFISALELRQLNETAYPTSAGESLALFGRWNFAPQTSNVFRYPDDVYDRRWIAYETPPFWAELSTSQTVCNQNNEYQPPANLMSSAAKPMNETMDLKFTWEAEYPSTEFYSYFYFAEVEELPTDQTREFYVCLNGKAFNNIIPGYLKTFTLYDTVGDSELQFNYSLRRTGNSNFPPIINALELYTVVHFLQSQTEENDVRRSNWQGDPCLPKLDLWEGLDCNVSDKKSISPRIKGLNLSSSGLTGNLSPFLSNLTSLRYLDLSNNSLKGPIPDFLAELPYLEVLDLSANKFSGSIPPKLIDKAKGGLSLRVDGYTCPSGDRKSRRSNKFVVPLLVGLVTASSVLLIALIIFWRLRRGRHRVVKLGAKSSRKEGLLGLKSQRQFTYSEILKMTNNLEKVLGEGGFGTVYLVSFGGTQVAVKVLSQSKSIQGYKEFQSEAELLTRVHHRNLTSLVGYCYEETNMALVYEYMAKGNLREILSDNAHPLSWLERLQIALDVGQGLDYLHSGCKPSIILRDIKSSNILLNENEAKLADFGLSRAFLGEDGSYISTTVVGTPGYLDPEYYETQRLHEKSDVFSLGIVILELITGRPVITQNEDKRHILQWVSFLVATGDIGKIVDPKLKGEFDTNSAWKVLEVAMNCASPTSSRRPNMAHVVTELAECLAAEKARKEGLEVNSDEILEANPEAYIELGPR